MQCLLGEWEEYMEDQTELHCVIVDLEKPYDRGAKRGDVVLYEEVRSGRDVCEADAECMGTMRQR